MANRKKTRPAKRIKSKNAPKVTKTTKKTAKVVKNDNKNAIKPKRPLSQYQLIRKAVSDYCKKNYNRRCTQKEISEIYADLKDRMNYDEKLTPQKIVQSINQRLKYRNESELPQSLENFDWFSTIDNLVGLDALFFKPLDKLKFDLSVLGLGVIETTYSDLGDVYYDEIYPLIRDYIDAYIAKYDKDPNSPPFRFNYDDSKSDSSKRLFTWVLDVGSSLGTKPDKKDDFNLSDEDLKDKIESETKVEKESETKQSKKSEKEIELNLLEAQNRKKELELEEKKLDVKLVELDLMTKAEFKKKWSK